MLSVSGCSSFAENCADPPLVTTSGDLRYGEVDLYLVQPDGRHETLAHRLSFYSAALSPDGTSVSYPVPEGRFDDASGYAKARVAVMSLDTRNVTLVSADIADTNVDHLQWSPDGSEIAFFRRGPMGLLQIVAVRVADRTERTLLELRDRHLTGFAWSSDGGELLVTSDPITLPQPLPRHTSQLWRYSIATGEHEVIETPYDSIDDLAWSPDDRLVAVDASIAGTRTRGLFVLDLESGVSTRVDSGTPHSLFWSGRYLLYTHYLTYDRVFLMRWDSRSRESVRIDRAGLDEVLGGFGSISGPRCSR